MSQLDSKSLSLINKICKGKKHIKLTIGFIANDEKVIKVFDKTGEIENKNYIYEVGSITKTFTASLMAKYILDEKMALSDSIEKYIDGLDNGRYYPNLKRLATHTSGYSYRMPLTIFEVLKMGFNIIFGVNQDVNPLYLDFEKLKENILKNKLKDKDYKWNYSNFAYAVLGYTLSVVSGNSYDNTMDEFISKELGLVNTYIGTDNNRNLHGFNRKNKDSRNWSWENNLGSPAGAISSTADDLLKYAMFNIAEKDPYLSFCHQKQASISKKYDMGLGWWLYKNNHNIIFHRGTTGCFSSFLILDKSKKIAVIILSNYKLDSVSIHRLGSSILENLQINKLD